MKCKGILTALLSLNLLLAGCADGGMGGFNMGADSTAPAIASAPAPAEMVAKPVSVGLLLPLNDPAVGEKMLNAAQMALFDLEGSNVRLLPKNSGTTPSEAASAAKSALNDGANLLVGPIYADSVRAVGQVARAAAVPVIAFSTDTSTAGNGVYLISVLPAQQVDRILRYAASRGRKNIAVVTTSDAYGALVASAAQSTLGSLGLNPPHIIRIGANAAATAPLALGTVRPDAVLLALGGQQAGIVSDRLGREAGLPPQSATRLGLGLWDEPNTASIASLNGAWFATPDPALRARFVRQYTGVYGTAPARLATQAYDAVALATVLSKRGMVPSDTTIQNPAGFSGLDGLFRLRANGLSDRGLAVLTINDGRIETVESAPARFNQP